MMKPDAIPKNLVGVKDSTITVESRQGINSIVDIGGKS
jgi:hypothetical protein